MKKICVIFGGSSTEHDISVITGMQLVKNVKQHFDLEVVYLSRENKFYLASKVDEISAFSPNNNLKLKEIGFCDGSAVLIKNKKKLFEVECVINCCHGGVGENGDLAGYFNLNKIRYTSSSSLASHLAMDKTLAKTLVQDFVPVVRGKLVTKLNYNSAVQEIKEDFSEDIIVKPNSLGSSIGVKACNKDNFTEQIDAIFELNDNALVEERIVKIKEYNQAALVTKNGIILSAIEHPLTKSDFLTFDDKYRHGKMKGKDRELPAKLSKELEKKISSATKQIVERLSLSGVVRVDYIFDEETKMVYFNEVNTIPGSMAFYLFEEVGIDYITLIEKLIENATEPQKFTNIDTNILKSVKL